MTNASASASSGGKSGWISTSRLAPGAPNRSSTDSTAARATYLETLHTACGNAKATLALDLDGGEVSWTGCLLVASQEDHAADAYVAFTLTFVRSAF